MKLKNNLLLKWNRLDDGIIKPEDLTDYPDEVMVEIEDGDGQAPVSGAGSASSTVPQSKGYPPKPPQGPPPTYLAKGSKTGPSEDGAEFVPGTRDARGPVFPAAKPRAKGKGKSEAGVASTPTGPARSEDAPMEPTGYHENEDGSFTAIYE